MNLVEHLDELRKRLIICLSIVALASVIAYVFSDMLLDVCIRPLARERQALYFFTPYEAFLVRLRLSLVAGIIVTAPFLIYQLWMFVGPGLYAKERRVLIFLITSGSVLFFIGAAFCYFFVLPFALHFFLSFQGDALKPLLSVKEYIGFMTQFILLFGIVFNLPLLSVGLTMLGIVNHTFLRKRRKIVLVSVFIIAACLTPPDVVTQILLAFPLIILYEACIFVSYLFKKT